MKKMSDIVEQVIEKKKKKAEETIATEEQEITEKRGFTFYNPDFDKDLEDYADHPLAKILQNFISDPFWCLYVPYSVDYFFTLPETIDLAGFSKHPLAVLVTYLLTSGKLRPLFEKIKSRGEKVESES